MHRSNMNYSSVNFPVSLRQIPPAADQAAGSVDLLQMVSEVGYVEHTDEHTQNYSAGEVKPQRYSINMQNPENRQEASGNDIIVQSHNRQETMDGSVNTMAHTRVCKTCSHDGLIYNNPQIDRNQYKCHKPSTTCDGSGYFNYLEFANRQKIYEPITCRTAQQKIDYHNTRIQNRSKSEICWKTQLIQSKDHTCTRNDWKSNLLNCFKSSTRNSQDVSINLKDNSKSMEDMYGSTSSRNQGRTPSAESMPVLAKNSHSRKLTEWFHTKRLLFFAGILLGILVALGGIILGFVVLAPPESTGGNPSDSAEQQVLFQDHVQAVTIIPKFELPSQDEQGWVYYSHGNRPGSGSRYTIINRDMTFSAAQRVCRTQGGHLPFVTSIREQIFLEDFLTQQLKDSDIKRGAIGFWLGARRTRGSHSGTCLYKQWKWVDIYGRDHGVINGFTAFAENKPDNYFNPEECLYISYTDTKPENFLKWDDAPCDIPTIGSIKVICEVDDR